MSTIPARRPEFHTGGSTPRPIRFNNRLWSAFKIAARKSGFSAADLLRVLMEAFVTERNTPAQVQPEPPIHDVEKGGEL